MHPKNISIHDFTYELPESRIAHYPLAERDASRLLIYEQGTIREDIYRHIDQYLPAQSLLVFNNTKVVEARLLFQKPTGGMIEIFCLEPSSQYADITTAMQQTGEVVWTCLIGGASKWKAGQVLQKKITWHGSELVLEARFTGKEKDSFLIRLSWDQPSLSFAEVLHLAGVMPLPPYIKRAAESADQQRYQTIYARTEGSVAAPTAGLHFTEQVFQQLHEKGIRRDFVTLHVGAGTFQPVKSDSMGEHNMHVEFIEVAVGSIVQLIDHLDGHITAVGTTSLRTIESLYWLGVKTILHPAMPPEELVVSQWDAYELPTGINNRKSLESLVHYLQEHRLNRLIARTQLLIAPGYTVRIPKALVTNFHQPQSTLLLLVAAFVGEDWKKVYDYALKNDFRFLSYGDGCLLFSRSSSTTGIQG